MNPIDSLYTEITLRLVELTWVSLFDLSLVTIAFFVLLSLSLRSHAGGLLRGILILGIFLLTITILLPLPTFDWLIQALLAAILVAMPIIFQPELRRLLDRLGRRVGVAWALQLTLRENTLAHLIRAVEHFAYTQTGALIAVEGNDSLAHIAETGIDLKAQVTSELVQSIFYNGNPLHDGAIILQGDTIAAAGCVLPLTDRPLRARRRLGTRHRAAVGLSEVSDAFVIVISEETGAISAAQAGQLRRPLDCTTLREQLVNYNEHLEPDEETISLSYILDHLKKYFWPTQTGANIYQFLSNISIIFLSFILAWMVWWVVSEQTNPAQQVRLENIPLRIENTPKNMTVLNSLPTSIAIIVNTTARMLPTLSSNSFQANVSLANLDPGLHHLPIEVYSGASQVVVVSTEPNMLDLELTPIITKTLPPTVDILDSQKISSAYELVGQASVSPEQIQVIGAKNFVEQVSRIQARMSVANASATLQELRPLRALDEIGREIRGIVLEPNQVQVEAVIRQKFNARTVTVQPVTTGTTPSGYWLSALEVKPNLLTLQGRPSQLSELNNFVNTLPIDISQAAGDLRLQIPLELPPNIQALDRDGNPVHSVNVAIRFQARSGYLVLSRSIEIFDTAPNTLFHLTPEQVDLLLSGPIPILNQIEQTPDLVRVVLQTSNFIPGENIQIEPEIVLPEDITARLIPNKLTIVWEE